VGTLAQACIDWMTLTQVDGAVPATSMLGDEFVARSLLFKLAPAGGVVAYAPAKCLYGMLRAVQALPVGTICHYAPRHGHRLARVITCTGDTLRYVRTAEGTTLPFALRAQQNNLQCSRLDVAIDVFDDDIERYIDAAKGNIARSRNATVIRPVNVGIVDSGTTLYIGKRQSSRFLRVYEKEKQMGVPHTGWIRIELETKRKVSRLMFAEYAKNGICGLALDIAARYKFKHDAWANAIASIGDGREAIAITSDTDGRSSNNVAWFLRNIKAVSRAVKELGEDVAFAKIGETIANL